MVDGSVLTLQGGRSLRALVFRRWADLGLLLLTSIGVGIVIWRPLLVVQEVVTQFLLPWGWVGNLLVGLVAATAAWVILTSLGARLGPLRTWATNPPAWPVGIISFASCSFIYQWRVGSNLLDDIPWAVQGVSAILLFLGGGTLAPLFLWISGPKGRKRPNARNSKPVAGLDELAKDPERLIKWLEREEPVSEPTEDYFDAAPYARRIATLLKDNPVRTIGLIGPYGCGKSSILKMAGHYLRDSSANSIGSASERLRPSNDSVVSEVSGWGFQEGTIAHHILDTVIRELSDSIDCLEVASVPATYRRIMTNSGGFARTLCALLSSHKNCEQVVQRLDNVVARAHIRLVIFLEDVDRNIRGDDFFNELAALLEDLKGLNNITFVLAIGQKYEGQQIMAKLCEHIEVVPNLAQGPALAVLRTFRDYCRKKYVGDREPHSAEDKEGRGGFDDSATMDPFAHAGLISRPIDNLCKLLVTPRILKASLRRTWLAWRTIHGEIDLDHLLICSALRSTAPEAFFLINENVAHLRGLSSRSDTEDAKKRNEQIRESLKKQLADRSQACEWNPETIAELIGFIFPGWEAGSSSHSPIAPQGVQIGEPTDYWGRLNREELLPHEIRDQEIIRAIESWKQDRNAPAFRDLRIQNALFEVEGVAPRVEQFGDILTPKEVRDLASGLFDLILKKEKIAAARDYPGFIELWRLSLKKRYDSHEKWILPEIVRALRKSLRFANDLYYYWRHQSENVDRSYPTPELRDSVVRHAQSVYASDHGVYMRALDRECPGSTRTLVVDDSSPKAGGPGLENEDWSWFGPVLLSAASTDRELGIPQVVVLLTDYESTPGDRGSTLHKAAFSDLVAEHVFGNARMRDLMELLARDFQAQPYDMEISVRFACCQGRAKEWLGEHPER